MMFGGFDTDMGVEQVEGECAACYDREGLCFES